MKKFPRFITSAKLNQKVTLFVIMILAVPVVIFSIIIFDFIQNDLIKQKIEDTKVNMAKSQSTIQRNVEMCNMSTQTFLNTRNLMNFAIALKENQKIGTKEKLEFYKNEISNLEKISNSNPYLYQIRVYVNAKERIEMMPILYNYKRLANFEWAKGNAFGSGTWQFDYTDTLFAPTITSQKEHIVSLVTRIKDYEHGEIGVIEVATKMDLMFPDIYTSNDENWSCFVDHRGKYYYDQKASGKWENEIESLLREIKEDGKEYHYKTTKLRGEQVIVACEDVKVLDGYLIKIVSLKNDEASINRIRNTFIICLGIGFGMVILLISGIIKALLKRLYEIMGVVDLIGEGDLSIRVPVMNQDEIGHLGAQINLMLEHMTRLMEQGIQKERLIKDTEIKALQNQINAHFIYNVLESIKMMAEINEEYDISDALTSLGKLLRYTMKWGKQFVTVEEEIEYIRNYLALINLRFDYKIILSINISSDLLVQQIPKMSLQPIVENAIYHGIEELAEDTTIYIKGIQQGEKCSIEIMDSGLGMSEDQVLNLQRKIAGEIPTKGLAKGSSSNGLGLKNVQDRITMSFGREYGISIVSKEKCYTKVIIRIPYITHEGGDRCKD